MDAARYARVKELFEAAVALAPAERAGFLARECDDDPALAREVADLLRHHEAAPAFLTGRAGEEEGAAERPMPKLRVPGFTIMRELGRGGMGVVVLAEQERPRREVALKFLRLDSLRPADVKRFEREAEILGRLSHAGIAHVYGVGLAQSEQGELPWIAMEYVRGTALQEYVAGRAPDLRDLVGLFADLCDAVEHAHQKGIVHRDLKPSNVLVDEHGQVRVLDFGVARLVGDAAGGGTARTRTGQMVGTLAYASPEQASGRVSEVGAHSDVYSLGVMLHEFLTGGLPYEIDESRIVESIQTICDEEPRRLRKARRDAPADLETVLLKTLEKEPTRRYASAGDLAADLRRYLAERPITARAPTPLYQVRKFVRRNRALTVSTAAVILALLVTVGVLLDSRRRDREQVARERKRTDLMARMVFPLVPEAGFAQDHPGMLEELDRSLAEGLERDPGDRALRGYRARSLYELGAIDQASGDLAAASRRFEEARSLREGLLAEDPTDLDSRTHLSQIYARFGEVARLHGDPAGELDWFQRAFELDQTLVREHPGDGELIEDLGWSLDRLTAIAIGKQDWTEADRYSRWRLEDATLLVEREPDNWKYLYNAAQAHALAAGIAGHLAPGEVEGHMREGFRLARRFYEVQPRRGVSQRLWAGSNQGLGRRLLDQGRAQEALPYLEAAATLGSQLLASDPGSFESARFLQWTLVSLFQALRELGLRAQAGATFDRARVVAKIVGENTPIGLFLLATSAFPIPPEWQPTPEEVHASDERALQAYQALFLASGTSQEMIEQAAAIFRSNRPQLAGELCRRLRGADEGAGLRVEGLLVAVAVDGGDRR